MKSLLAIEWLKIKSYRTFWVLIGLFMALFVLWFSAVVKGVFSEGSPINVLGETDSFGEIWGSITAHASNFIVFIAILIAILVTNEYNYKTQRQNMIDGWSRMKTYHSKWLLLIVIAFFSTLFVFVTGVVFGAIKSARWDGFTENIIKIAWMFLLSLNYFGFAMLIGHLIKRSGLAISLLVIYSLMFEHLPHFYFFMAKGVYFVDLFLPLQCSDQLVQLPSFEMLLQARGQKASVPNWGYALASVGWIFIYYIVGRVRLQKSDW